MPVLAILLAILEVTPLVIGTGMLAVYARDELSRSHRD